MRKKMKQVRNKVVEIDGQLINYNIIYNWRP